MFQEQITLVVNSLNFFEFILFVYWEVWESVITGEVPSVTIHLLGWGADDDLTEVSLMIYKPHLKWRNALLGQIR